MLERIPNELKQTPAWTVSGSTKIPLEPHLLFGSNIIKGYSPKTDKLTEMEPVVQYLKEMNNPELKAAFRMTEDIPYVIVDIEPEGMIANNPYFKWPFLYLEYSRNYGLHGILPFNPPEEYAYLRSKFTIKDEIWDTEVLIANGHFVTFTFDERPLNQYDQRVKYANSVEFQTILAKHLDERTVRTIEINDEALIGSKGLDGKFKDLVETDINDSDATHLRAVLDQSGPLILYPSDDTSREEYKKILQLYGILVHREPAFLSEGALSERTIPVMWRALQETLPPRHKHYSKRNSVSYGRVPWLAYTMLSAIEYIRNQALNDPETAKWVTHTNK